MKLKYLTLLLLAAPCLAADYHVTTTGSDGNGCTNATTDACLTPVFGASKLTAAGDNLYIHAGTYAVEGATSAYHAAAIYPRSDGTAENRITIRSWPGDTVILDGGESPTNGIIGLGNNPTWYDYITIKGLTIIGQVKLMYGDYAILEDCDISGGGDSFDSDTGFGDVLFIAGTGTTVRNNRLHDNAIAGGGVNNSPLIMEYDSTDLIIENNDIYNSVGAGIHLKDNPETVTVRYNYFHDNQYSGLNVGVQDTGHNVNIYQNIFRNNSIDGSGTLFRGQLHLLAFVDGINIYNNTFSSGNYWADISHGDSTATSISAWNNISYNPVARHYDIGSDGGNARITQWLYADYNNFYNDVSWKNGGSVYSTIADWRSASSFDTHSVITDPGFINASGNWTAATDYKRVSYTTNGRGGAYTSVMGAYITGNEVIGYSDEGIPDPTCSDGIQNGDETGIDCGGSCPACSGGTQTRTRVYMGITPVSVGSTAVQ